MSSGSAAVSQRRRRLKELVVEFMGGKCFRCGWDEHPAGLTAHHVDPTKKSMRVGSGNTYSWERTKEEAKKCMLLCANCHNVIHVTGDSFFFDEKNIPTYEDLVEEKPDLHRCIDCANVCSSGATRCLRCSRRSRQKILWPEIQKLKQLVEKSSYLEAGRLLGVSDNAIRKRIRNHSGVM